MQHVIDMPRLTKVAARNRTRGARILFATAMIVTGTALTSMIALTRLAGVI